MPESYLFIWGQGRGWELIFPIWLLVVGGFSSRENLKSRGTWNDWTERRSPRGPRGSGSTPLPFILMHRTQRALVTSVSNCVELRAHVSSAAARAAARECCVAPPGALRGKATGGKSDARDPPGALRGKATGKMSDAPVPPGALRGEAPKRGSGAICCAAIA